MIDTAGIGGGDWGSFSLDEAPAPLPSAPAPAAVPMSVPQQQAPMMQPQMPMRPRPGPPPAPPYLPHGGVLSPPTLPSPDAGWNLGVPLAPQHMPQQGMGAAPPSGMEGHMLGLSLLLTGIGAAVGLYYGGAFGGAAGALLGGSAVNAVRAVRYATMGQPEADREALISGSYAVITAGAGGYMAWRVAERRTTKQLPGGGRL